jgi:hypothetical protein
MWQTAWSLDGAHVLYTFADGDTGANGVWAWDVASGEQRVIVAAGASSAEGGSDGRVIFASGYGSGHIFYGTTDGGFPRIITEGVSPVWWVPR